MDTDLARPAVQRGDQPDDFKPMPTIGKGRRFAFRTRPPGRLPG